MEVAILPKKSFEEVGQVGTLMWGGQTKKLRGHLLVWAHSITTSHNDEERGKMGIHMPAGHCRKKSKRDIETLNTVFCGVMTYTRDF